MPLLGPVYLGTILKNRGHDVRIFIEDIQRPDYDNLDADVVGISILTSTAKRGYLIAGKFPKEKVIIGGVHASLLPEESLEFCRQVVVGEAEEVICDIVEGKIKDKIVQGIPVQDLDKLPYPDFSLIQGYKVARSMMPVSTSRGCPFDCTFCSVTKVFGRKYRFRSALNVVQELKNRKAAHFFFCDDNFTAYPLRTHNLLKLMINEKIRSWSCQVRCDVAKDEALLGLMAKAGCAVACVGFESVNEKTLVAYQKKQSLQDIISAIKNFHKKKIKVHGMFVLGGDDDNIKTVWDTLRFAIKQKIDTIQMSILTPFPGTKVHESLNKEKRIFSRDWSLYDGQHVVFHPKLLSPKQLQVNIISAYCRYYSLYHSLQLMLQMSFRNAMFRLMGYKIIRDWKTRNRLLKWLVPAKTCG
jgi:anaerobic magnesium-protoporphyrin IX monomethyl ester cyclase